MLIQLEDPTQPEIVALIQALDAYQAALYPAESNHFVDVATLAQPHVLFAVARAVGGPALACGAVVLNEDEGCGEIKRMYVHESSRGRGLSKAILAFLEREAARRGCAVLRLETGIHQAEALGLYARCGYQRRGPFGSYAEDPLSVFMEKNLSAMEPVANP